MTTALRAGPDALEQRARVVERAEAKTPSLSRPSIGGIHAELPVASSSVSYGVTLPSSPVTVFSAAIDVDDADADAQIDVVAAIPLERVDDDVVGGLLAGEHRRQHHAVVVDVRLVAEHRDVEHAART